VTDKREAVKGGEEEEKAGKQKKFTGRIN